MGRFLIQNIFQRCSQRRPRRWYYSVIAAGDGGLSRSWNVANIVLRMKCCYTGTNIHVSREHCPIALTKSVWFKLKTTLLPNHQ